MYAILRTQKLKTFANVKGCADHHSRSRKTDNADPDIKNLLLVGSGDPYLDTKKRIDESGAHYRSNSVKAIELLLTASPEFFRPNNPDMAGHFEKQPTNAFKQRAIKWLENYFGKNNVVSAILHLDEATPHLQAIVVPVDETPRAKGPQTRLNAKKWTGDSKKLTKMQDSFANAVKDLGLERGIRGSQATHTKLKKYYGELNKPIKKIKIPAIEIPETYFTEKSKKEYVRQQKDLIYKNLKPQILDIYKASSIAKIAHKKRVEYQKTAHKVEEENKLLKKKCKELELKYEEVKMKYSDFINKVRDIELDSISQKMGLPTNEKGHYLKNEHEVINITGNKFYNHYNKQGGGGSIDFTMHCMDCDFKQAVSWLADTFNFDSAVSAVNNNVSPTYVNNAVKERKPYSPPRPALDLWHTVKKYLVEERKLNPAIVDYLHDKGSLYATKYKGFCNIVFKNKYDTLAEKRGLKSDFKGLEPGSKPDDGGVRITVGQNPDPKKLVLVESGIDAISYAQSYPDQDYIVMSTAGARPEGLYIKKALDAGYKVVCGYDNDVTGNNAYNELIKNYPGTERHAPDLKDWNDDVMQRKSIDFHNNHVALQDRCAVNSIEMSF